MNMNTGIKAVTEFKRYGVYIDKAHYSADSEHIGKNQLNRYDRYRIHVPAVSIPDKNNRLLFSGAVLFTVITFQVYSPL